MISNWLQARLFLTNFRPVPLTEFAVFGSEVYAKGPRAEDALVLQRNLLGTRAAVNCAGVRDTDGLVSLVEEELTAGGCVLVFCASRAQCQSCAEAVMRNMKVAIEPSASIARAALVAEMIDGIGHLSSGLEDLMTAGVTIIATTPDLGLDPCLI